MSELTLKRSIMLDSGEIISAGTALTNYGDFTPKSIAPSLIARGEIQFRGKNRAAFKEAGEKNTIFFFRIPRECIDDSTVSPGLKKLWVKGSDAIAPFFCSVKATRMVEVRQIEELLQGMRINFFDKNCHPIQTICISSVGALFMGSLCRLSELESVKKLHDGFYPSSCITYYYPGTSTIKSKTLQGNKFFVEFPAYRIEKYFDELDKDWINCYNRDKGNKFSQEIKVMDEGDNEWYKRFISTHSWVDDSNYTPIDNDYHLFCRYRYYDGKKNVSGLTILHKSTNPFRFFKKRGKSLKVIIKEHCLYC